MSHEEAAEQPEEHVEVEVVHAPVEVELQRSVRVGRLLIGGAVLGALVGMISSFFFPVAANADYELRQVVGVTLVFGAAIGLALGAVLALILGIAAKRQHGAAMAVQTDVR